MSDTIECRHFIGGEFVAASDGAWLDSVEPANERILGRFAAGTPQDVHRAVAAAQSAQVGWADRPALERGELLTRVADALLARTEEIIELEARDTGNTIGKLARDVTIAANSLRYFGGLATQTRGETVPASVTNLHVTLREPYGVVGRIVPFNHPFMFAAARMAAPLAAGNAIVIKTPEQSPMSSRLLAEACRESLPPGVVNIVHGLGPSVGDALVRHGAIRRIGFTGSVPTGLAIQRAAAESGVKHLSLELGGKNPMIVCADADPGKVAAAAVAGMNFSWAGQSCGSTSRLLLHDSLYDEVLAQVIDRVEAIRVADPLDPAADMGPVNSRRHLDRILGYVAAGRDDGARLVAGGTRPTGSAYARGYWLRPTVFAGVRPEMRIAREEIFGPVLSVLRWTDESEALRIANGVEYGLTASVWTRDIDTAVRLIRRVEAGYVWVNGNSTHFVGTPFGGRKQSGLGSEESLEELLSYTETKAVHVILGAQPGA